MPPWPDPSGVQHENAQQLFDALTNVVKLSNCSSDELARILLTLSSTIKNEGSFDAPLVDRVLAGSFQDPKPPPTAKDVGWLNILFAALLLAISIVISVFLGLKLHKKFVVGAVRCILQLLLLSLILGVLFAHPHLWLVLVYAMAMTVVTAFETLSRPAYTYKGMLVCVMGVMILTCSLLMMYAVSLLVPVRPWWHPSTFIPLLGLMLAQATSGISNGLATVLEELAKESDRIEMMLCFGANRFECSRGVIQSGCIAALKPLVRHMSVMGVVGMPELMMGQLMGGAQPSQAARYQMIVTLLCCGSTSLSVVLTVTLATLSLVDKRSRLVRDKLMQRDKREAGIEPWLQAQATKLWRASHAKISRCLVRCHLSFCPGGLGQRWRNRSLSLFDRHRNKFKRSSTREDVDFGDDHSLGSRLQDVIFSDDESYLDQDHANEDAAAEQPLLPTLAPDLTINTHFAR